MSKYGYLDVFQRVPWSSRKREPTVEGGNWQKGSDHNPKIICRDENVHDCL